MNIKEFSEYAKADTAIRRYLKETGWKYTHDGIWEKEEKKVMLPVYLFNSAPSMLDRLANVIDQIAEAEGLTSSQAAIKILNALELKKEKK